MIELKNLLLNNESWLVKRILKYAQMYNFTKYSSTLEEAWRISIQGLSESISQATEIYNDVPELDPDDEYVNDPISQFAIFEAIKHRERGIPLDMFLALTKYYKQAYLDLILFKSVAMPQELEKQRLFVERSFDRIEIAYTKKWTETPQDDLIEELRRKNRTLVNEKNKYLTVFESVTDAIILVDSKGIVKNLNHSAAKIIDPSAIPGGNYYNPQQITEMESLLDINTLKDARKSFIGKKFSELYTWVATQKAPSYFSINSIKGEKYFNDNNGKIYQVYSSDMLDVSKKYNEIIVGMRELATNKGLHNSADMQQYLDYLINDANILLLGLDKNARVILFNNAAERITGYSKQEIMNTNWFKKLVPRDRFPEVYQVFRTALEENKNLDYFENSIITKNGEERIIIWKNDINYNLYGDFTIFSVGIDITDEKREREKSNRIIKDTEEKFSLLFKSMNQGVTLHDAKGTLLDINPKALSMFSLTKDCAYYSSWDNSEWNVFGADNLKLEPNDLPIKRVIHNKLPLLKEILKIERVDRKKFIWLEISVLPQLDVNGDIKQVWSIFDDITQRMNWEQKLLSSEAQFKDLFDKAPIPVLIFDTKGLLKDVNKSALNWYASTKEVLLSDKININDEADLLLANNMDLEQVFKYHETKSWYEIGYLHNSSILSKKGKIINLKMYPIKNITGTYDKIICFIEDVTYQKLAKDNLEQMVAERTRELNEAKEKIEVSLLKKEEYADLQSRFINMISHEYKTPLQFISSSAAVLEKLVASGDQNKSLNYIHKIHSAVNILNHLVEDVMNFVEVENSEIRVLLRTVNMVDYLSKLINEIKILDKSHHILKFHTDRELYSTLVDANLFRQVMTHIISNAMKFSPEDSDIDIYLKFGDNQFIIEIKDNGVGIANEDLKYLFTPFYKGKKNIGIKAGTGLGLQLVKRFVEAMKGTISIESEINKGTNVILVFPSL